MPCTPSRLACLLPAAITLFILPVSAAEDDLVFRSDVSLVRVDTQVVDRTGRAITGLQKEDFVLFEGGKKQEIRNFESEDMPLDVVMLIDVSGSMQPHVERLVEASNRAMQVLARGDRVAVMVFDRSPRLRLPFRSNLDMVSHELEVVVGQETFDGGTDITRAMYEAANYISKEGRREARRAIVILTDDQTERDRDESGVLSAFSRADVVMSALIAPDAMSGRYGGQRYPRGGGWPSSGGGGGNWPNGGGGGGVYDPLGGIILGRRGPYGNRGPYGGGGQGPVIMRSHTRSAGTSEIATQSGGDSMRVDDAAALETTLLRLRQRYALHFNLPEGIQPGQERQIEVQLADAARRRYPGSEVRYRRSYSGGGGKGQPEPVTISRTPTSSPRSSSSSSSSDDDSSQSRGRRRRPAVNEDGTRIENTESKQTGGWRRSDDPAPASDSKPSDPKSSDAAAGPLTPAGPGQAQPAQPEPTQPQSGGWRRVKPGEQP